MQNRNILIRPKLWFVVAFCAALILIFRTFLQVQADANPCGCLASYLQDNQQTLLYQVACFLSTAHCIGWPWVSMIEPLTDVSTFLLPLGVYFTLRSLRKAQRSA